MQRMKLDSSRRGGKAQPLCIHLVRNPLRKIAIPLLALILFVQLVLSLRWSKWEAGSLVDASRGLLSAKSDSSFKLCAECDCSQPNSFLIGGRPSPQGESIEGIVARFIQEQVQLDSWQNPVFISNDSLLELFRTYATCPDQTFAAHLPTLRFHLPTLYLYTRTGPASKLHKTGMRPPYLRQHAAAIQEHLKSVSKEGYRDGTLASARNTLWIVVEDHATLDPTVLETLHESGLNYIYLSHGVTRKFGKAQWVIAEKTIQVLRDNLLGDGPVLNVDDDSRILPSLYDRVWRVKKAVAWPVGNIHALKTTHTNNIRIKSAWAHWEGPIYEQGQLVAWFGVPTMHSRRFNIDMNGFAINSSMIGVGRPIAPPQYIPWDLAAGESEFLENIYEKTEEMEPLCDSTYAEECFLVWHNGRIVEPYDWKQVGEGDAIPHTQTLEGAPPRYLENWATLVEPDANAKPALRDQHS